VVGEKDDVVAVAVEAAGRTVGEEVVVCVFGCL
jgi:hypothetical protein